MHYTTSIVYTLLSFAPLAAQADLQLDEDDISQTCQSICRPIRELSDICDVDGDQVGGQPTEDNLTLQCICTNNSFDVASIAPLCQSCMQQNPDDSDDVSDDMQDINEIVSRCGFSPATYASDQANTASAIVVNAVRPTAATQLTTTVSSAQSTATGTTSGTTTGTTTGTTSTGQTTATGTAATTAATTAGTVSGASSLGSLSGGRAMMLTYVIGAAGVGAWLI